MRIVIGLVRDDLGSGARPRERALTARGTVMTALDLPRLVFSGDFQAEVSTVNNDVRHYDTATFQPRFQHVQTGPSSDGWWNLSGSGVFRLLDCPVRTVVYRDGASQSRVDEPEPGSAARSSIWTRSSSSRRRSGGWGAGRGRRRQDGLRGRVRARTVRDTPFGRQAPPVPNGQSASAVYTSRLVTVRSGLGTRESRLLDELLGTSEDSRGGRGVFLQWSDRAVRPSGRLAHAAEPGYRRLPGRKPVPVHGRAVRRCVQAAPRRAAADLRRCAREPGDCAGTDVLCRLAGIQDQSGDLARAVVSGGCGCWPGRYAGAGRGRGHAA